MLKNTQINRAVTRKIAQALDSINEKVVYVGGAVVSLYIDDPSADDVRPTKDIDLTLEIVSLGELESLREELVKRGFYQTARETVICRFQYDDVLVDVMSTTPIGWAPGNRWFKEGFSLAFEYQIEEVKIKLLPLPYFLAAKFDAFFDRGINDLWASHDYEDIVYLLNHTSDLENQVLQSEGKVQEYLMECASKIIQSKTLQEGIIGNLYYDSQQERFDQIMLLLSNLINGNNSTQ